MRYELRRSHRYGYAAGCEAVALPRRRGAFYLLGYALGAVFGPLNPKGVAREIWLLSAGHSHRLTSGGKAEPHMATDF